MNEYKNFEELKNNEKEGEDFQIVTLDRKNQTVIIAPHGGGIEPGTSEIARRIANEDFSLALFEGMKNENNKSLHITSTNFDEPQCLSLIKSTNNIIAIHGEKSDDNVVYLGGLNIELGKAIRLELEKKGFDVCIHTDQKLQGKSIKNICNQGSNKKGVQLELSSGLRNTFFLHGLSKNERQHTIERLNVFAEAIRKVVFEFEEPKNN